MFFCSSAPINLLVESSISFLHNTRDSASETDSKRHLTKKKNVAGIYIINSKLFLVFLSFEDRFYLGERVSPTKRPNSICDHIV